MQEPLLFLVTFCGRVYRPVFVQFMMTIVDSLYSRKTNLLWEQKQRLFSQFPEKFILYLP